MKQKLSNYIAEKLLASGITDVFMITGGGAMHLDDALGHQEGLHCLYNHHEQACAMAAEAYARILYGQCCRITLYVSCAV